MNIIICCYCFFLQKNRKALMLAQQWEDQKMNSLAAPWKKAAREFEALANHHKRCTCNEEKVKKPKKKKKATMEWP